jgi:hypothetical protein
MHLYHVQYLAPLRKTQNSLHLLKWGHWLCSPINFTKQYLEPPWQQVEAGPNLQLCNGRGNCIYAIKQPSNLTRGCTCTQLKVQPLQATGDSSNSCISWYVHEQPVKYSYLLPAWCTKNSIHHAEQRHLPYHPLLLYQPHCCSPPWSHMTATQQALLYTKMDAVPYFLSTGQCQW